MEELSSVEILYNDCYGCFDLSEEFKQTFAKRYPDKQEQHKRLDVFTSRIDKDIIGLVKELGSKASSTEYSHIKIGKVNFPSTIPEASILTGITLPEYDGVESPGINKNNILFDLINKDYFSSIGEIKKFINYDFDKIAIDRQ